MTADPSSSDVGSRSFAGRLPSGTRLGGRYTIRGLLGAGAMGEVYEALDEKFGHVVALKTLPRLDGPSLLRFKREFRSVADLRHPGLVGLGELACEDDLWFFTMELVRGEDWVSYARRGEPEVRRALAGLGEALVALHTQGRVHRDLKPSNVMVDSVGRVVVLDFGLVREAEARDGTASAAGVIQGTPHYMAPEQAAGEVVGAAADMYSVGAMLYEALTGAVPIDGAMLQVLLRKQSEVPEAPSQRNPGAAADLSALAMRLLAIESASRPQAAELARLGGQHPRPSNQPRREGAFFGRRAELAAIRAAFEDSRQRPVSIVLEGESGLGKSSLARAFVDSLRPEQAFVFSSRCHDRERVPFKVIDAAVDGIARQLERMPRDVARQCLPAARVREDLFSTFPVLRSVGAFTSRGAALRALDRSDQRRQAFEGLRDLVERLGSARPVVFVVDDLQWADADSDVALEELLLPKHGPPALWIFTSRGDGTSRVRRATPRGDVRTLALEPLDAESAAALASALGCPEGASATIAGEAAGHPMFVTELARAYAAGHSVGVDEARGSLDEAIRTRVAALEPEVRKLVEVAVVAGVALPDVHAFVAAGLDPESGRRAFGAARDSGLLRRSLGQESSIEPYHDRVREAVGSALDEAAVTSCHEAICTAIAGSSFAERRPDLLATHAYAAGRTDEAREAYVRAARAAFSAAGYDAAVHSYERALSLRRAEDEETATMLDELALALHEAGRVVDASERLLEAARIGEPSARERRRTEAGLHLVDIGDIARGRAALEPVLDGMGLSWPSSGTWLYVRIVFGLVAVWLWSVWAERTGFEPTVEPAGPGLRESERLLAAIAMRLAVTDPIAATWFTIRAFAVAVRAKDGLSVAEASLVLRAFLGLSGRRLAPLASVAERAVRIGAREPDLPIGVDTCLVNHHFLVQERGYGDALSAWRRIDESTLRLPGRYHVHRRIALNQIAWFGMDHGDAAEQATVVSRTREAARRGNPMDVILFGLWTPVAFASEGCIDELARADRLAHAVLQADEPSLFHDHLGSVTGSVLAWARQVPADSMLLALRNERRSAIRRYAYAPRNWSMILARGLVSSMALGRPTEPWLREADDLLSSYAHLGRKRPISGAYLSLLTVYVELARGTRESAVAALDLTIALAESAGVHGIRLFASHLRGRILGGDEGARIEREVEDEWLRRGARDPRTLCLVMAPHPDDPALLRPTEIETRA